MSLQLYLIDTETTGLSSKYHEMTEISIIRYLDRVQLTEMIRCDYPERANMDALIITRKTLADLERGNSKEYIVNKVDRFLNEDGLTPAHRCFIAHNASFDRRFIHALYEKVGKICPVHLWADTMALSRQFAKQMGIIKPKVNLQAACDLVGIKKISDKHNSRSDSRNTFLLWKDLVENKKIDYLPFIKTAIHTPKQISDDEECGLDPDLLDFDIE